MKKKNKNRLVKIMVVFVLMSVLFSMIAVPASYSAFADGSDLSDAFDNRNVLDDLLSSTIGDQTFDINDYPYDANGNLQLINFVEYCYSYDSNNQAEYGLYLYIYNPQAIDIDVQPEKNKVQLASHYIDDIPDVYEKWNLKFLSCSLGDYNRLFYKFKVDGDMSVVLSRLNSNERRYDISGLELLIVGQQNADEYNISGTYKYRGYVAGFGPDAEAESTIEYSFSELETITLDVRHTYFRSGTSSAGAGHQNELNSVYFSVPERFMSDYGNLQRIKAEWWEYKTQMIVALSQYYDIFKNRIAVVSSDDISGFNYSLYSNRHLNYPKTEYDYGYNVFPGTNCHYWEKFLPIVLQINNSDSDNRDLSSEALSDYIYSYNKSFNKGTLSPRGISADLFTDTVDFGRTRGYNLVEIDAGNAGYNLLSYDSNHSWWDKFVDFGFNAPPTGGSFTNVMPIYEVKPEDVLGDPTAVASRLLISNKDVGAFLEYYASETVKGNKVFLFRYALTDYYSQDLSLYESSDNLYESNESKGKVGFRAQESVFLDFDIISLSFCRDGVLKVIPVVMSPIDIINAPTSPQAKAAWTWDWNKILDWFEQLGQIAKYVLIVIACIIALLVVMFILSIIVKIINLIFGR